MAWLTSVVLKKWINVCMGGIQASSFKEGETARCILILKNETSLLFCMTSYVECIPSPNENRNKTEIKITKK